SPSLSFTGAAPLIVTATPTVPGGDYSIKFSDFDYQAVLQTQFQLKLSTSLDTFFDSPQWNTGAVRVPFITTPFPVDGTNVETLVELCQPNPSLDTCGPLKNPGLYTGLLANIGRDMVLSGIQPTEITIPVSSSALGDVAITSYAPKVVDSA